ncbi:hypothetical protein IscW_ISCW016441 [Ixodes scapularis]|uniref:Uncharacterized protein n=1 Tax=Ixodes scapularis TaxID=6945 RepID=B7P519_IXOSC|nr:hypothetical protein IscW_ISCW016441 [Ixodes scapularis]|eukprot:XP_002406821.1 hypothetical protein IscW_ISCW016441 [Ixodes scapularis]
MVSSASQPYVELRLDVNRLWKETASENPPAIQQKSTMRPARMRWNRSGTGCEKSIAVETRNKATSWMPSRSSLPEE